MATNIKQEALQASPPGPVKMAACSDDGPAKCSSAEQSFSAMQGLILAEDRRTKEKDMNNLQNVSILLYNICYGIAASYTKF